MFSSCINDLILSFDSKAPTSELLASHTFSRFFHRCSVNCDWTRVKFIQLQLIVLKSSHMATPVIPSNYQTCCFLQSIIFCFIKPLLPWQSIPCTQLVSYLSHINLAKSTICEWQFKLFLMLIPQYIPCNPVDHSSLKSSKLKVNVFFIHVDKIL